LIGAEAARTHEAALSETEDRAGYEAADVVELVEALTTEPDNDAPGDATD
jgi:hypothetical protein